MMTRNQQQVLGPHGSTTRRAEIIFFLSPNFGVTSPRASFTLSFSNPSPQQFFCEFMQIFSAIYLIFYLFKMIGSQRLICKLGQDLKRQHCLLQRSVSLLISAEISTLFLSLSLRFSIFMEVLMQCCLGSRQGSDHRQCCLFVKEA